MSAATARGPILERRGQPGSIRALFLAIAVHVAFFALIVFGVAWQITPAPPVTAELWDQLPPAKIVAPPPEPAPEPLRPPEPVKAPDTAKPTEDIKPKVDPEIALKAERDKREKEKRERLERQREEEHRKAEAQKKREQEEAAKKKRDDDKRRVEEERARREAEKAREAAAAERRKEFDKFVNDIRVKIRGRANVPDTVTGNPEVHVRIRILPGGEVLDIAIARSSGNRVYDTAIERAIRSASPLPVPPPNSELFPQFRDLNLVIRHER